MGKKYKKENTKFVEFKFFYFNIKLNKKINYFILGISYNT